MVRFGITMMVVGLLVGLSSGTRAGYKVRFTVRYENITAGEILKSSTGKTAPLAIAPGLFVVGTMNAPLFRTGTKDRGEGVKSLAEDGDPSTLSKAAKNVKGVVSSGAYFIPVGELKQGSITPCPQ
jgi:hypothetical protein